MNNKFSIFNEPRYNENGERLQCGLEVNIPNLKCDEEKSSGIKPSRPKRNKRSAWGCNINKHRKYSYSGKKHG